MNRWEIGFYIDQIEPRTAGQVAKMYTFATGQYMTPRQAERKILAARYNLAVVVGPRVMCPVEFGTRQTFLLDRITKANQEL